MDEETNKTDVSEAVAGKSKLRPIGSLFADAWRIFTEGWVKFLLMFLISIGVFIGLALCAIALFLIPFFLLKGIIGITVGVVLVLIPLVALAVVVNLATIKIAYSVCEKDNGGIADALKYGFKHFGKFLWVSFVAGLLILLGYIFLIIPGIIIGIILSLVTPIFILEEKYNLSALKRSRELVKGYFWPVLGRFLLLGLISVAVSSIQYVTPDFVLIQLLQTVILMIVNFILAFYGIIYSYLIYKDLSAK